MQSLTTKICMGLRLSVFPEPEAWPRRQSVNCRNRKRRNRSVFMACSAERNENDKGESGSSRSNLFLSRRSHNYAMLKRRMDVAAKSEVSIVFFLFYKWLILNCECRFSFLLICCARRITKRLRGFVTRWNVLKMKYQFCVWGGCWKKQFAMRDSRCVSIFFLLFFILNILFFGSHIIFL